MPVIKYCATPAGRIAYSAMGTGPPLLCDSGWVTHLGKQLELFSFGPFAERLAERFTVIRYDKPGCGLSDRDGADMSFDALVLYGMCASGRDLAPADVRDSIVALVGAHWGLGSKVLAGIFVPVPPPRRWPR